MVDAGQTEYANHLKVLCSHWSVPQVNLMPPINFPGLCAVLENK